MDTSKGKVNSSLDAISQADESPIDQLHQAKQKHPKNPIFSYINLNSIRHKLNNLHSLIGKSVDVLSIA